MAGTYEGGKKAAEKNLASDPDFYKKIGLKGAEVYRNKPKHLRKPRGFAAATPEERIAAGKKGGTKSRRGKSNA